MSRSQSLQITSRPVSDPPYALLRRPGTAYRLRLWLYWPGAAATDLIASGSVHIPRASLLDEVRTQGDEALTDVPGMPERLDIRQFRALWPGGQVTVRQ